MRKFRMVCFVAAMICFYSILPMKSSEAAVTKTKITLLKSTNMMEQGSSYAFKAKVQNGKVKNIVWKSSNKSVLNITSNGKVKAKKAGQAVITASIGNTSVKEKIIVYPSLQEISEKNEIVTNLDTGVYSSVSVKIKGNDYDIVKNISKDKEGYTSIISGSSVRIRKENLEYFYDTEKGLVSIYASENVTPGSILPIYQVFSNEKVTKVVQEDKNYRIFTETDIAGLTEEEQKNRTGRTDGIIQQELVVNKKTGRLEELIYTIFFDKEDLDFHYKSHEVFSYNENSTEMIPKAVHLVMNTDKTRTVTIISAAGTQKEKKEVYTLPDSMPLYVPADVVYYQDAACTKEAEPTIKHKDGTYDSSVVYVK